MRSGMWLVLVLSIACDRGGPPSGPFPGPLVLGDMSSFSPGCVVGAALPPDVSCPPCSGPATVDGAFTGWKDGEDGLGSEWFGVKPIAGKFARMFVCQRSQGTLHVLNDWLLRDDADICPDMYNRFRFLAGGGLQSWEVRVYGDDRVEVTLDGAPMHNGAAGRYSYGSSPLQDKKHTIFEFVLPGVLQGNLVMTGCDPASASMLPLKSLSVETVPGCADPDGANVVDPIPFVMVLSTDGKIAHGTHLGPALTWADTPKVHNGKLVSISGVGFGDTKGSLEIGGEAVAPLSWSATKVTFEAPEKHDGYVGSLRVITDAGTSNTMTLRWPKENESEHHHASRGVTAPSRSR